MSFGTRSSFTRNKTLKETKERLELSRKFLKLQVNAILFALSIKHKDSKMTLLISRNRFHAFSNQHENREFVASRWFSIISREFLIGVRLIRHQSKYFPDAIDTLEDDVFIISHWLVNADNLHSQLRLVRPLVVRLLMYR